TLPEGRYQAKVAGTADGDSSGLIAFDVRRSFEEQLDLKARPDLMARIASDSGGTVLDGVSLDEIVKQFQIHQEERRSFQVRRISAWDRWWVFIAVLAFWSLAWGCRRSSGLI